MVAKPDNKGRQVLVLDTNVLMHDPEAMLKFEQVVIGIPSTVLEELDMFKTENTSRGRNSREAVRILDKLRSKGSLKDGVALDNGSTLQVLFLGSDHLPVIPFTTKKEDNEILTLLVALKEQGWTVTFITKDLNARVKADVLGVKAENYQKEYVSQDEFFKGWRRLAAPAVQLKKDNPQELQEAHEEEPFLLHEYALLESQHNPHNYRVFRHLGGGKFMTIREPQLKWPLQPRNPQQLMALDLLLEPTIPLVTLFGQAGTGKTFLALLAGLHEVLVADVYQKLLVSRPVVPLGKDIGYLPGDVREKLHSWMLPIYDNMEFIAHQAALKGQEQEIDFEQKGYKEKDSYKKGSRRHEKRDFYKKRALLSMDELIYRNKMSIEAITYMRGRSIPYQYILIDEVQNLTPHEVKTLVTRVGQGSKIVLTGDPYQIDSPYLDFSSNGLVVTSEKLKGQALFGSVFLEHSERSPLSELAADYL